MKLRLIEFFYCSNSLRMRKDLRDIFDQIRAMNYINITSRMSDDTFAQNNNTNLFAPRTLSDQTQSKLQNNL